MKRAIVVFPAPAAGCTTTNAIVDRVWRDNASVEPTLGKTLARALTPDPEVAGGNESGWPRQLRGRGVDVDATDALLPGRQALTGTMSSEVSESKVLGAGQ